MVCVAFTCKHLHLQKSCTLRFVRPTVCGMFLEHHRKERYMVLREFVKEDMAATLFIIIVVILEMMGMFMT